jgi:hypothetical protein
MESDVALFGKNGTIVSKEAAASIFMREKPQFFQIT